jgi:2-polyprenyl-3-methyl-5-hydroxy-6-metoxy-1,4-benzoquinol methylase
MNWKEIWDLSGSQENPFAQVGRGGGKNLQDEDQLDAIVQHIVNTLSLTQDDVLLDMCCGNGLLTSRLSKYCKKVVGVDFSEVLIQHARINFPSIDFICADALQLDPNLFSVQRFDKVNLYFSFQYFDSFEKGKKVIEGVLPLLSSSGKILLGDIPDREYFFSYYNSLIKIGHLIKKMLKDKNDMGKFWSEDELMVICNQLDIKGEKRSQPRQLPYAYYRMDFVLSR